MSLRLLDREHYRDEFEQWVQRAGGNHEHFTFAPNETVAFTTSTRPLSQSRVALVTTAGALVEGQPEFDLMSPHGDPSIRVIPGDVAPDAIRFSHSHYDHTDADRDPNCVFPLQRLHELAAVGVIGSVAPEHFGLMGWSPDPRTLRAESAVEIAARLKAADVDLVLFSPG